MEDVFWGLMIPLLGTTLGAACVFFMRGRLHRSEGTPTFRHWSSRRLWGGGRSFPR